jgi:hypothetical protein
MLAHEINIFLVPTHPPSLNFCSSASKAKSEAMQEMGGNTSAGTCLDLPNKLMCHTLQSLLTSWSFGGIYHLVLGG